MSYTPVTFDPNIQSAKEAMATLKNFCDKQLFCDTCPLSHKDKDGVDVCFNVDDGGYWISPNMW